MQVEVLADGRIFQLVKTGGVSLDACLNVFQLRRTTLPCRLMLRLGCILKRITILFCVQLMAQLVQLNLWFQS